MDLGFKNITDVCPKTPEQYFPEIEYIELRQEMIACHEEFNKLQQSLDVALNAQTFLKRNKIDSGMYNYLCTSIGFEEYVELPDKCITPSTAAVCTEICLEGLGSFIGNICKKIIAFFKKLYETIMNFFGIRTYRHRQTESKLYDIESKLIAMSQSSFNARITQDIKCSVPTSSIKELSKICADLNVFYQMLGSCKDVSDVNGVTSQLGGIIAKLGHKVQNEYKLVKDKGLPYSEFTANYTLSIRGDLGISNKGELQTILSEVLNILNTMLDVQKWYPANLKKYAARATDFGNQPATDPETAKLQAESLKQLNNEQKCQALMCASICLYTHCVEYLCARTIATLGAVVYWK